MKNNAIVQFKNTDTEQEINVSLTLDRESEELSYDVNLSANYTDNRKDNFLEVLVEKFLISLKD